MWLWGYGDFYGAGLVTGVVVGGHSAIGRRINSEAVNVGRAVFV